MCRLYGLNATRPTRAACELLDAQNALIRQSREDARGLSNLHGWGVGRTVGGSTACFRQAKPAGKSAHVRRATVGEASHVNTHPFRHGDAMLIHNGHVPAFDRVRPLLRDRLSDATGENIQGTTDSEHVLALLLQLRSEAPEAPLHEITRRTIRYVQSWCDAVSGTGDVPTLQTGPSDVAFNTPSAVPDNVLHGTLALNLVWTDGTALAGARLNRTLYSVTRSAPRLCPICNTPHGAFDTSPSETDTFYRSTTLASEPITEETWTEVPNGSVFHVSAHSRLHYEAL